MWSNKSYKSKRNQKGSMALGRNHQQAFNQVKATICQDVVLAYPDFSKPFKIYTDASANQLGAVITQDNRPLAFFSRKLTDTQ